MAAPQPKPFENQPMKAGEVVKFDSGDDNVFDVHVGPRIRAGSEFKACIYLGHIINEKGTIPVVVKACGRRGPDIHISQSESEVIQEECEISLTLSQYDVAVGFFGVSYNHPAYFCLMCMEQLEPLDSLCPYVEVQKKSEFLFHIMFSRLNHVATLQQLPHRSLAEDLKLQLVDATLGNNLFNVFGDTTIKACDFGSCAWIPKEGSGERPLYRTPGFEAPETRYGSFIESDVFTAVIGAVYAAFNDGKSIADSQLRASFIVSSISRAEEELKGFGKIIADGLHPVPRLLQAASDAGVRLDAERLLESMEQLKNQHHLGDTDQYLRNCLSKAIRDKRKAVFRSAKVAVKAPPRKSFAFAPVNKSEVASRLKSDPLFQPLSSSATSNSSGQSLAGSAITEVEHPTVETERSKKRPAETELESAGKAPKLEETSTPGSTAARTSPPPKIVFKEVWDTLLQNSRQHYDKFPERCLLQNRDAIKVILLGAQKSQCIPQIDVDKLIGARDERYIIKSVVENILQELGFGTTEEDTMTE